MIVWCRWILLLSLLLSCGCGTISEHDGRIVHEHGHLSMGPVVYRGVRSDIDGILQPGGHNHVIHWIDFPFSLIADTVLLPWDLYILAAYPSWEESTDFDSEGRSRRGRWDQ